MPSLDFMAAGAFEAAHDEGAFLADSTAGTASSVLTVELHFAGASSQPELSKKHSQRAGALHLALAEPSTTQACSGGVAT